MDFALIFAAYGYLGYRVWKKSDNIFLTVGVIALVHLILGEHFRRAIRSFTGVGEGFHGGGGSVDGYPYALAHKRLNPEQCNNRLTDLYRRLHNLEAIMRGEVFQFNSSYAGGNQNTPAEPYIGEAYDRARMKILAEIKELIRSQRLEVSELHPNGSPLGGNYDECASSDYAAARCQYRMDKEGRILGIPSQVGNPAYYY